MTLPIWARRFIAANRWALTVVWQTLVNTWRDGFNNAGNLAYLSLLTLFPFFIVVALVAGAFGRTDEGMAAVKMFLEGLPPQVAQAIGEPVDAVVSGTSGISGNVLLFSVVVMLWTISGTIETIREILRKAYEVEATLPFWRYRLLSVLVIFATVGLMLFAFAFQVMLTGVETFVASILPQSSHALNLIGIGRLAPTLMLFVSLYLIFYTLTPQRYRGPGMLIWPGAVLTTLAWIGTTMALPGVLQRFTRYDVTYGSLAGIIIVLLFFYLIGLGLVIGAHFNAALAITPRLRQNARETSSSTLH